MTEKTYKRSAISKSVRFEVFKRDAFKCQYCGRSSPDVVLHVDHINPVSKGGENDMMNLITSCQGCNLGKSDKTLDDSTAIQKQRQQLEELSERREQLEMMLQWRDGLADITQYAAGKAAEKIIEVMGDHATLNESGIKTVERWVKRFSLCEVLEAIDAASEKKDVTDHESAEAFFNLIPKVAAMLRKPEAERRLYYVRGILRNRMYVNEGSVMQILKNALAASGDIEMIEEAAKSARNWTEFRGTMEEAANG